MLVIVLQYVSVLSLNIPIGLETAKIVWTQQQDVRIQ